MALPAVIAGAVGAIGGSLAMAARFTEHPFIAYMFVLMFLLIDSGAAATPLGYITNAQGISGALVSWVFGQLGVHLTFYAWQILILLGIFPLVMFAINASSNS